MESNLNAALGGLIVGALSGYGDGQVNVRLAALYAVRSVDPDLDVYDRIRVARYLLTGSEDQPDIETVQPEYPHRSGDVLVLGPEIFSSTIDGPAENTVISWRGENFVPQRDRPLTGVVGPDPEFVKVVSGQTDEDAETTPSVEETLGDREPAPSSGQGWRGRRNRDG